MCNGMPRQREWMYRAFVASDSYRSKYKTAQPAILEGPEGDIPGSSTGGRTGNEHNRPAKLHSDEVTRENQNTRSKHPSRFDLTSRNNLIAPNLSCRILCEYHRANGRCKVVCSFVLFFNSFFFSDVHIFLLMSSIAIYRSGTSCRGGGGNRRSRNAYRCKFTIGSRERACL